MYNRVLAASLKFSHDFITRTWLHHSDMASSRWYAPYKSFNLSNVSDDNTEFSTEYVAFTRTRHIGTLVTYTSNTVMKKSRQAVELKNLDTWVGVGGSRAPNCTFKVNPDSFRQASVLACSLSGLKNDFNLGRSRHHGSGSGTSFGAGMTAYMTREITPAQMATGKP
ncbi:hypothetical protein H257_15154 [Aphanomyces astaci]|uniref:Uncharacterized protein n=1 Tax=Aphanomyces astaci TaxID=112090 RepID=W4FQA8_APHAT|nr:hypothetical protein H257_15154 [Aphanomyces astaci]ETV69004.1 hypothetical protein H257_15154 [Aphanomyces astaci]|eukprot:XP_009841463.1 hypothetical protein H257_15154 [Aphanomyces astaci]